MLEVWFLYALSSAIISGLATVVDKLMLEKRLSSFSYFVAFVPLGLACSLCVLLFFPTNVLSIAYAVAFVAGLFSAGAYFLYAISIREEEASRVAALTSLPPAFVAVLAVFFLNEILSANSYAGIILMILGAALISYKRNDVKKTIPISLILILIAANLSFSLDQTLSKVSLNRIAFWPFLMMFMFGRSVVAIPGLTISSVRRKVSSEVKGLTRNFALTLALGPIMWILAIIFLFYAASLGPITLVSTTMLISPLFTLFFAILLTKYLPEVLEEEVDRMSVALKLVAIVLIVLGTYLIIA